MEESILSAVDEIRRADAPQRAETLLERDFSESLEIFQQLDPALQCEILEELPSNNADQLLRELDPDDRVRLLDALPDELTEAVLSRLGSREWRLTQKLLSYEEGSAGRIMAPEYLPLPGHFTALRALQRIQSDGRDEGTVNALPVLDENGVFRGMVSLARLVMAKDDELVSDLMEADVPTIAPESDQEEAARLIQRADLLALPVVDEVGRMLGMITVDDALDILQLEREEDFALIAASAPLTRPYFAIRARELIKARIVWLLLLAVAGALTVKVLSVFESVLEEAVVLSLFIPLLIGIGGNSGAQSATTVSRAIAMDDLPEGLPGMFAVVSRETMVGFALGGSLGLIAFPVVSLLFSVPLALTVSLTVIGICALATLVGSAMPLVAERLGIDPAVISAPVVTTVVDASGLILYFMIARAVLGI